jgi:hypothetical protein
MNLLGVRLNLLIGPDPVAAPAPVGLLEALIDAEVTHSEKERSGFRLTFAIGRSGPLDFLDYPLVANPLLQVNARVVMTVFFDITPSVIMDGIVTQRDVFPGDRPGQARLVLSGHDLSIAMDREQKQVQHPAQDETLIAMKIAGQYAQYLMAPMVLPPVLVDPPLPMDRTPVQTATDWDYLTEMADRFGHVVYVEGGPAPLSNVLYWGPPKRFDIQQKAINVNLGPLTNATGVSLADDALALRRVESKVIDRLTGQEIPVITLLPTRPPLGAAPAAVTQMGKTSKIGMETSGLNAMQAMARAQAMLDSSADNAIRVSGTLDSIRYNAVLKARAPVDLRGVGYSFDGKYMVESVTHRFGRGAYAQDFSLYRSEIGALTPIVRAV